MDAASILHATALAKTYVPKRKIKLIRTNTVKQNEKKPPKRHIKLMREPFKEKVVKKEQSWAKMPPRKKVVDVLPPIQEKVTMVHVAVLEKKMEVLPVEDVEVVHMVLHDVAGKSYYRDTAKNKLFNRIGPKAIGSYVGRWDPLENTIRTDISDSDAEQ
jgi:hypothetical protein